MAYNWSRQQKQPESHWYDGLGGRIAGSIIGAGGTVLGGLLGGPIGAAAGGTAGAALGGMVRSKINGNEDEYEDYYKKPEWVNQDRQRVINSVLPFQSTQTPGFGTPDPYTSPERIPAVVPDRMAQEGRNYSPPGFQMGGKTMDQYGGNFRLRQEPPRVQQLPVPNGQFRNPMQFGMNFDGFSPTRPPLPLWVGSPQLPTWVGQ